MRAAYAPTGRGELPLITRPREAGYVISLYYVGLDDLALSVRRVATSRRQPAWVDAAVPAGLRAPGAT